MSSKRPHTLDLLSRFRLGDAEAYEVLWRRYQKPLQRFIARHVRGPQAGQVTADLFQDTHVAALKGISTFEYRRELAFFFWLCEIARRLIAQHRKKHRDDVVPSRPEGDERGDDDANAVAELLAPGPDPHEVLIDKQHLDAIAFGLGALSEQRRKAVMLRYVDNMPNEKAAAAMGLSAGAFRVLLSRALTDLRAATGRV